MIFHFFSECQSDESGEFAIFYKIGCHGIDGNVPSSAPKTLSFGEKVAKMGPADPEIICLREIIKKKMKKEGN